MTRYTFKHKVPLYFSIVAEDERDAVMRARKAIEETSLGGYHIYLRVELTAGAHDGRIYIEPGEMSTKDICKKEILLEISEDVPF